MRKTLDEQIWIARVLLYLTAFMEIGYVLIFEFMKQHDGMFYNLLIALLVAVIFIALAVWSKKKPNPALLIAMILYLADSVIFLLFHPISIGVILVRGVILFFIIRGVNAAMTIDEIKKKEAAK